ncbi:MAG: hypothetical protein KJ607_09500, partial [Bacteroidetes bacterium]|nr:hypothetical protein [Bacteroidota bacterium]
WFIDKNKVVDNFTIEMRMRFPTANIIDDVFDLLNVNLPEIVADATDIVVYHKFQHITVLVSDENPNVMTWSFTDDVIPLYNVKDNVGNYVLFDGINVNSFSRCMMTFEKQVKGIRDLTTESANNGYGQPID